MGEPDELPPPPQKPEPTIEELRQTLDREKVKKDIADAKKKGLPRWLELFIPSILPTAIAIGTVLITLNSSLFDAKKERLESDKARLEAEKIGLEYDIKKFQDQKIDLYKKFEKDSTDLSNRYVSQANAQAEEFGITKARYERLVADEKYKYEQEVQKRQKLITSSVNIYKQDLSRLPELLPVRILDADNNEYLYDSHPEKYKALGTIKLVLDDGGHILNGTANPNSVKPLFVLPNGDKVEVFIMKHF